ncbi:hypothetical protein H2203_001023 [Taxawa tesnikishii (nom. ined.)]|nr:hypothetical protein H2203_001023 [Dothideales sp. JES 119]
MFKRFSFILVQEYQILVLAVMLSYRKAFAAGVAASCLFNSATAAPASSSVVNQTTCNGQQYIYRELAGYGFIPSNARDKYGDTLGGIGSSIALDKSSWKKKGNAYTGTLWALPDRGWNTEGTLNYQNRVHKVRITLTPNTTASVASPSGPNLQLQYLDTVLFTDPSGQPVSGLDPDAHGPYLTFPGFPQLPSATYTGDGFGGSGPGGRRVSIDSEGLVLAADGSFWVSDEYGPYIYHFSSSGRMLSAIAPPNAILPIRNSTVSFSANSPPRYDPNITIIPENPVTGRANNQGFEGLTVSPSGRDLYVLLQSATDQEGGLKSSARRYTRFLHYDISCSPPRYVSEYIVPLPLYTNAANNTRIAAQSEIHYISSTQFLVLARDNPCASIPV